MRWSEPPPAARLRLSWLQTVHGDPCSLSAAIAHLGFVRRMHTSSVLDYVPLALLVALLAFWGFSSWQLRRRVACLFDPQETDEHELHRVSNQLDALNERCPTNSFSAQRLAHIDLRGQDILRLRSSVRTRRSRLGIGDVDLRAGRGRAGRMDEPLFRYIRSCLHVLRHFCILGQACHLNPPNEAMQRIAGRSAF